MRKTVYYDITHLVGWKGNLTGIPRTTDEIARRLRNENDVVFVSWVPVAKVFKSIDIDEYYDVVDPNNRSYFKQKTVKGTQEESDFLTHIKRALLRTETMRRAARKAKRVSVRLVTGGKAKLNVQGKVSPKDGDVFFIPCGVWDDQAYIDKVMRFKEKGVKPLFLCYDLLPIVVPQFSGQWGEPMRKFLESVGVASDRILAISEFTKSDLNGWLKKNKLKAPPVDVIRLGDVYELAQPKKPVDKKLKKVGVLDGKDEFVLCTGTIEARKNHTLLYYTYKLARSRGIKLPKLVIAGRKGHRTDNIIDIIQDDPEVNQDITILFDVSDQELSWLYQNCQFTVYPSFYEGWGLPIAESIANGVPCICSNTTSMVEVADGFVEYFNPASPEECLKAFTRYTDKKSLQAARAKAKKYKKVSWDLTYAQVKESIKQINPEVLG